MTEEAKIIVKNQFLKDASQSFDLQHNRKTYILGGRKMLLLLCKHGVLDILSASSLIDNLDLNNIKI